MLHLHNTLTRQKERFEPIEAGRVRLYVCGPTVYGDAHTGHAKSYISFDVLHRYLEFSGYKVLYVQNITDVGHLTDDADEGDDKIARESAAQKKHPMEIAEHYTRRYYEDMEQLNILPPDIAPRATGHIIEQIELIKRLIADGYAYEAGGNVYFDVSKDKEYGKLSGRSAEEQESSGRVSTRSDKRSPQDFALWKVAEPNHIMRWLSPWGDGFPGWHIECSAMSMKYLGETIDIHGGGLDNQFPHHECEIAQSECATKKPFVRYWLHNNMVVTDGRKMGKSLGNAMMLRDWFNSYDPLVLRFTMLQSHYRSTTEFKPDVLEAANTAYQKLIGTYNRVASAIGGNGLSVTPEGPLLDDFIREMDDDLNTPKALAVIFELARVTNQALDSNSSKEELAKLHAIWNKTAGDVLGILPKTKREVDRSAPLMDLLIGLRNEARAAKNFAESDRLRQKLEDAGVLIEDTKAGTTWRWK